MSSNAFPTLEREHAADIKHESEARQRLADWRAMVAELSAPDTAESVQASVIAEHKSRQIPGNR